MKKDEILNASRKEHRNKDLAEMGGISSRKSRKQSWCFSVLFVFAVISVLAHTMIYSPWVI